MAPGRHCDLPQNISTNPQTATQPLIRPVGSVTALNYGLSCVLLWFGQGSTGRLFSAPCSLSWGHSNMNSSICSQAGSLTWLASSFLSIRACPHGYYFLTIWWLSSNGDCPKRGGNCMGSYDIAQEAPQHCFSHIVLVT